jgi:ribonuclease BN (tRNA processing enzyme)
MPTPATFSVQVYGCRGSFPVAGPAYVRYGGATSCVVVRAGSREIVLDAGTGIVQYGQDLIRTSLEHKRPPEATVFISHLHLDHLFGLPFFGPMYMPQATVRLFGPRMGHFDSFEQAVDTLIHSPFFPVNLHEMHAVHHFRDLSDAQTVYFLHDESEPLVVLSHHPSQQHLKPPPARVEVEVQCMRGYNHPKCGVFIYKVICQGKSVVYAPDTEGYVHGDQRLIQFARGADLLIHDAMYTSDRYISMPSPTQGYGHSTIEIACTNAEKAGVKQLLLFHHDPNSDDEAIDAVDTHGRSLFAGAVAARDGMILSL